MSMTDPIADLLTRIRNGIHARKARVEVPSSRIKSNIVRILKEEGFISDFRVLTNRAFPAIQIDLKWKDSRPAILGLKRVSKPGCRTYVGKSEIPKVRSGQGIAILTTSQGVVSDRIARRQSVGGEVICEVW